MVEDARELAEAALRRGEERLRAALSGPDIVIAEQDRDLRYTYVSNESAVLEAAMFLGRTDRDLFGPAHDVVIGKQAVLDSGQANHVVVLIPVGDRKRWFEAWYQPRFDSDGQTIGLISTGLDITERRLVEDQLRQAQKMEAIGNLTGGMAHDFNNLLGVIIGNLDLLRAGGAGAADATALIDESLAAAVRGADLTRRLLAFARRQPLAAERIDVNLLVAGMTKLLSRVLGEEIGVSLALDPEAWPVIADPAQLEAALANLATNARDAMPEGGRLMIATGNRHLDADYAAHHADVTPGDYVMVEFSDTGIGMNAGLIGRIFEPFFTTKEPDKGTGLGLSMVFGFMKQSGGHINVYSEVDVGTTFRLYLPRSTTTATSIEPAPAPIVAGGHETILVVEDNAAMRRVLTRQLTGLGYRVEEVVDAAMALRLLDHTAVDLLLTDVVMAGGMSGVDLARIARIRWPSLKILLTSGFPRAKHDGDHPSEADLPLLSKPYRKEELARVLRGIFGA